MSHPMMMDPCLAYKIEHEKTLHQVTGLPCPPLQARAREDSSSDDDTKSCDEDGIYDDGEHCCYKERTLKQIIGGDSGGCFPSNSIALFKYSILGPDQSQNKCRARPQSDFYQAKE